ncbi:MAG: flagellar biosynthetic protein FliR [Pseudomonadales bacterium]|nr:flagellar biosynthetic protein FliR [Pseudomonadales bacterium]
MLEFTYAEIMYAANRFLLPFFRIAGFFMVVPIFGSNLVTMRVRLMIAIVVTLSIVSQIKVVPEFEALSLQSVPLVFNQLIIGIGLGFLVMVFIQVAALAGQIMAMQMGLGFAMMMDPVNGVNTVSIGQLYLMLFTMLYLAVDGHLITLAIMIESFNTLPLSLSGLDVGFYRYITTSSSWMFKSALKIALPAIIALYVVNFTFGVMSRAAQQLQVFSIGFPFTIIYGLVVVWIVQGVLLPQFNQLFSELQEMMHTLVSYPG